MSQSITLTYQKPSLSGDIKIPGDKSISHRSVMFGSLAKGRTTVSGFLLGEDCLSTIDCFRKLGVHIELDGNDVAIESPGVADWNEPSEILYTGNSGTTTRLMAGILAGSNVFSVMTGDDSIAKRPMQRVTAPLRKMGAKISGREDGKFTPLAIEGAALKAIEYDMPVASAQVKSAILLAALRAEGKTTILESVPTRDHTERMMRQFGLDITSTNRKITLEGGQELKATHVDVPGDISSAAFFLVAAAIAKGSRVTLENVGLNPTRDGIIEVMEKMGADFEIEMEDREAAEPSGTIHVRSSQLTGIVIEGSLIPRLIDEIPVIALLATQAKGKTIIRDAEELKVKETDRITAVVETLKKMGANIEATEDGMIIEGPTQLSGAEVDSYGDHRIGMMASIASLITEGSVVLNNSDCISISYPEFFEHLETISK
ncbi:3-phosphoshikimate 1-carboxyvinyltransferase [Chungangia koreensis]|uniref:3-phosphoshikimate 1-carboxyvinyltransferase n=1 Tax=Chungangia koreensis TaxID=752657 RepID=A0ABV8X4V7_9LACT